MVIEVFVIRTRGTKGGRKGGREGGREGGIPGKAQFRIGRAWQPWTGRPHLGQREKAKEKEGEEGRREEGRRCGSDVSMSDA